MSGEVEQIRTEIAQRLATRLGIKEGIVTYPIPKTSPADTSGTKVLWAFEVIIRKDGENTGRFIYTGPWHEDYFEAIKLALDEVSQ